MNLKENKTLAQVVSSCVKESNKKISAESITEWAEKNIVLVGAYGTPGPLRLSTSRYLIEPLKAMQSWNTKEVVVLKATQTAGTLSAEIFLQWALINRPMPTLWLGQSDNMASLQMTTRLRSSIMANKALKPLLPQDVRLLRKDGFDINGINFKICGPSINNLQSSTRGIVICDELAFWEDGNLLAECKHRLDYYNQYGMGKLIIVSQAGNAGFELDNEWKTTTMEEWNVPCLNCGNYWVPDILHFNAEGKSWSEVEELKNIDGTYNIGRLEKVLTLQCPHCQHLHRDTPQLKQRWNAQGRYIATNPDNIRGHRGFRWTAIPMRPWIDLVERFLSSTAMRKLGNDTPFIEFFQKRMARPINPREYFNKDKVVRTDVVYDKSKWEDEFVRCFTIDVQETHFVGVIRAWSKDGRSRQLWVGKLSTIEEVLEKQKEYNIPYVTDQYTGQKRYLVAWDTGFGQRSREIYAYIIKHGHIGFKGEVFKKGYTETIVKKNGTKIERYRFYKRSVTGGDPNFGTERQGKERAPLYLLATDALKKILVALRDGKSHEWLCLPIDNAIMKEFNAAMFSEELVAVERGGRKFYEWQKISKDISNDFFDVENYNICLAAMAGVQVEGNYNKEEEKETVSPEKGN